MGGTVCTRRMCGSARSHTCSRRRIRSTGRRSTRLCISQVTSMTPSPHSWYRAKKSKVVLQPGHLHDALAAIVVPGVQQQGVHLPGHLHDALAATVVSDVDQQGRTSAKLSPSGAVRTLGTEFKRRAFANCLLLLLRCSRSTWYTSAIHVTSHCGPLSRPSLTCPRNQPLLPRIHRTRRFRDDRHSRLPAFYLCSALRGARTHQGATLLR